MVYSEKPNAFLIILDAILRFGLQNDQSSTGFIRFSDIAESDVIYSEKPNAFLILFEAKTQI